MTHDDTPTLEERKAISVEHNVKPFVLGIVSLGVSGLFAIVAVSIFAKPEMAIAMSTMIVTFLGTMVAAVMMLTRITEVKERMDGRMDELLDITAKHSRDEGIKQGEKAADAKPPLAVDVPVHHDGTPPDCAQRIDTIEDPRK